MLLTRWLRRGRPRTSASTVSIPRRLMTVTDARAGTAHLVTVEAMEAGRQNGAVPPCAVSTCSRQASPRRGAGPVPAAIAGSPLSNEGCSVRAENESPQGAEYSISPGVPCPETVVGAVMTDGGYLLIGRTPDMPAAFVAARDADPLRYALYAAFGHPSDDPGDAEPPR